MDINSKKKYFEMLFHLGFREVPVILDLASIIQWKTITIDTGASQSTLQDIKVPEYGGCYMYKNNSLSTQNRYIFWRVCHDVVELWEESLDINFVNNHVQLKFADTPVLEGLSIHETKQHIVILLATVSSVHRFRLPHPQANSANQGTSTVFNDLSYHTLREYHNHHLLNNDATGEGLPHTASTYLVDNNNMSKGDALFILGQSGGSILLVSMTNLPYSVHVSTIKTASLINRFFTGFVPTIFRGVEGTETVSSLVMEEFKEDVLAFGVCFDGRLRAWSCNRMECILVHNTLENTGETGRKLAPGAQRHLIRSFTNGDKVYLSVFLSFTELQLIIIFQPVLSLGQLSINLIKTLYPPQLDLVDLTITESYIWSLWTDINNEAKLLYSPVNSDGSPLNTPGFKEAILEPFPEKEIPLTDPSIDSSEIYLKELLTPNRFSAYTLQKALGIYRRNPDSNRSSNPGNGCTFSGLWKMADDVEGAFKDAIDLQISTDMSEEEVAEIKLNAWANFYSHTLQYHQVAKKAVSIVKVGGDGLVAVMRKQSISWMRPLDALELLSLGSLNSTCVAALASTPFLNEDPSVAVAAVAIAKPLRAINNSLDPEVAVAFCLDLHHLEPPDQVASSIAISLLSAGGDEVEFDEPLSRVITNQLSGVSGIVPGLQAYLKALTLDLGNPDALTLESSSSSNSSLSSTSPSWLSGALSSKLGSSLLAATVSQLAEHRLELCRDLLLLQHILLQFSILSPENKNKVHTSLIPKTTLLTQAYFALNKVCTTPASIPSASNLETSRRQLAALALSDSSPFSPTVLSDFPSTTLELFIRSSGGCNARTLVSSTLEEEKNESSWSQILMPLATTIAQLAWPISKCLALVEFLVWGNQHAAAQEYIRLLQTWCEWNSCSRKFLLGISLLNEGEARKAMNLLLAATEGVATEEYLGRKIAGGGHDTPLEEAQVQYCLKIIRLLEQSGHISLALEVAKAGIDLAPSDDPGLAALYSVSFKYHLDLEHHDEAFTALMACPDQHRRRNCLRQIVITLYERKCLSTLVGYNYGILEPEVITILENRARSADILVTNYYDLLFAFHISKHNFKKGSWVMYECALRLNKEGLGEQGLLQQAKCYLACINCLRHVPPDQAWIIKPLAKSRQDENAEEIMSDEELTEASEGVLKRLMRLKKKPQIVVLEISDLEREYQMVHARLKLFKVHASSSLQLPGGPMNTSDTISLLIHAKLFRDAMKLTHLFNLSLEPIFEGLALACIDADKSEDKSRHYQWLSENGILRDTCEGSGWWTLLKNVLEEEELGQHSHLHKTVMSVILLKGHSPPAWLCDSYKKRNCGELLRLYLCEGLLEEATRLAINLIDALLGVGTQQMGLPNALHAAAPPVWVPYSALDHLILELKEVHTRPQFCKIYETLMQKVDKYLAELQRVSRDRVMVLHS